MRRCGRVSLDHALRYSQNVEFGLDFVLNRVEEVKSTYIVFAAYPAETFLFLTNLTSQIRQSKVTDVSDKSVLSVQSN